jgi:CIC family chloride channel protein
VHPAIGGAATGGMTVDGIAGNPYKTITLALTGKMTATAMAVFCVLKLASAVSSYSSGGSGGILAPTLFMGAMLGRAWCTSQ